jgi:hypothetical protein
VNLRGGPETQKEHRYIAERVQETLVPLFPNVSIALGWKKEHEEIKEDY